MLISLAWNNLIFLEIFQASKLKDNLLLVDDLELTQWFLSSAWNRDISVIDTKISILAALIDFLIDLYIQLEF